MIILKWWDLSKLGFTRGMMILNNVKFKINNWDSVSNDEGMWIKVDSAWLKPRLNTISHRLLKGMSKALEIKMWQNGPIVSN